MLNIQTPNYIKGTHYNLKLRFEEPFTRSTVIAKINDSCRKLNCNLIKFNRTLKNT